MLSGTRGRGRAYPSAPAGAVMEDLGVGGKAIERVS
jgi:hypothetical protein